MTETNENKISFTASTPVLEWLKTRSNSDEAINAAIEKFIDFETNAGEGLLDKDVYNEVDGELSSPETRPASGA